MTIHIGWSLLWLFPAIACFVCGVAVAYAPFESNHSNRKERIGLSVVLLICFAASAYACLDRI